MKNNKRNVLMELIPEARRAFYLSPEISVLPFVSDGAICETSFASGDITPGQGDNWGNF